MEPEQEPEIRNDGDVDEAVSRLVQTSCPVCKSKNTRVEVPWLLVLVLFLLWYGFTELPYARHKGARDLAWFGLGIVLAIVAAFRITNRYCRDCGARFRRVFNPNARNRRTSRVDGTR